MELIGLLAPAIVILSVPFVMRMRPTPLRALVSIAALVSVGIYAAILSQRGFGWALMGSAVAILFGFTISRLGMFDTGRLLREEEEAHAIVAGISHHVMSGRSIPASVEMSLRELDLVTLAPLRDRTLALIDEGMPAHAAMCEVAEDSNSVMWARIAGAVLEAVEEVGLDDDNDY